MLRTGRFWRKAVVHTYSDNPSTDFAKKCSHSSDDKHA
jgi:hypothetical protein